MKWASIGWAMKKPRLKDHTRYIAWILRIPASTLLTSIFGFPNPQNRTLIIQTDQNSLPFVLPPIVDRFIGDSSLPSGTFAFAFWLVVFSFEVYLGWSFWDVTLVVLLAQKADWPELWIFIIFPFFSSGYVHSFVS